jgi:hypothetical protein
VNSDLVSAVQYGDKKSLKSGPHCEPARINCLGANTETPIGLEPTVGQLYIYSHGLPWSWTVSEK